MPNKAIRQEILDSSTCRDHLVRLTVVKSFTDPDIKRRLWMFLADCLARSVVRYRDRCDIWSAEKMVAVMRLCAQGKRSNQDVTRWAGTILEGLPDIRHPGGRRVAALAVQMGTWNLFPDSWAVESLLTSLFRCVETARQDEYFKSIEMARVDHFSPWETVELNEERWQEARLREWLSDPEPDPISTAPHSK